MNRIKILKTATTLLLAAIFMSISVGDVVLAISKGNDELFLKKPLNNAVVSDVVEIKWFMKEANQGRVPFQIDIFNWKCSANGRLYGTIAEGKKEITAGGKTYTKKWDTTKPLLDKAKVSDGNYCLRICVTFNESPNNFYSLCDKHTITVSNNNRKPRIVSTPTNLNLKIGDTFVYQLKATDPDGDTLRFSLEKAPQFLSINKNTGKTTSKSTLNKAGSFEVKAVVRDGKGKQASQVFTLNVTEKGKTAAVIEIISPTESSIFSKDKTNRIAWIISSQKKIENINLAYSKNTENWIIIEDLAGSEREHVWDTSQIASGEYYVRVKIEDEEGSEFEKISPLFTISNDDDNGGEQAPLISELNPEDDAVINEKRPTIMATITSSDKTTIELENITVLLNEEELENCTFENQKLSCQLDEDLDEARHSVSIEVTDSDGARAVKEWFFEVDSSSPSPTTTPDSNPDSLPQSGPDGVTIFGRTISPDTLQAAGIILCVGLLLLIVPWLIYSLFLKRKRNNTYQDGYGDAVSDYQVSSFTPDQPAPSDNYVSPPPLVSYENNTYEPTVGSQDLSQDTVVYEQPTPVAVEQPIQYESTPTVDAPIAPAPDSQQIDYGPIAGEAPQTDVQMPSIYSDEEVPDWLKNTDSNTGSTPVAPAGSTFDLSNDDNLLSGSQGYSDFGLAAPADDTNKPQNLEDEDQPPTIGTNTI